MAKLADAIYFDYIEELCDEILDKFDCDEDIQVSIIGKYKEMKAFLKEFMKYDNVDFDCIELHDPECNKYDKEYIVDITNIEGNISFYCVPCYEDGRYFRFDGDVLYLLDGTKQAVLNTCEYDEKYFVIIGEDECDCCEDCVGECPCDCHKEDKEITPTSSYTINGKPVNKEQFDKKYDEIRGKYEKNMKRMLVDYADFMDDINNIFARMW